jgi:histidinol-phosphate aminotransferase
LVREEILALTAYEVHDASGMVKLDAMENPYSLPQQAQAEIGSLASRLAFNRYPDAHGSKLKEALKAEMAVPHSMEIMLGNGSDELIQIIAMALAKPGAALMSVEPSFVMYQRIALYAGMRYVGVPLERNFALDCGRLLDAIVEHCPAVLFLAYPNNPTGNLFDRSAVLRAIEANRGLTVLDEAYHPFAQTTFMDDLEGHSNLLVMRTLSKLGLAGLRLGFVAGRGEWLSQLEKLRLPYNVSAFTQAVVPAVLHHTEVVEAQAQTIRADRDGMLRELKSCDGVEVFETRANFILFKVPRADEVFCALKARGILIKNLNRSHPMLQDCLRVTVGTADENRRFLAALVESLIEAN